MKQREGLELPQGRWITATTSSVQSVLAAAFNGWVFMANLPDLDRVNQVLYRARTLILLAMESFPEVLAMSVRFSEAKIHEKAWSLLFKHIDRTSWAEWAQEISRWDAT